MGKKIKLFKGSFVNEEGVIVNPELPRNRRPSLQKKETPGKPLADRKPEGKPIEDFHPENIADTFSAMYELAIMSAGRAKGDGVDVRILPEKWDTDIRYFGIMKGDRGYVVYHLESDIYYREAKEFAQLLKEIKDKVPGRTVDSLKMQYRDPSKPLKGINVRQREDCFFMIASIFSSLTGKSYCDVKHSVSEKNCVIIKRNKLGTDGLVQKSLLYKEAKYGTEEQHKFQQEVEDKQKQEPSVVGCLDQQPEEEAPTVKKTNKNDLSDAELPKTAPQLPNVHRKKKDKQITESAGYALTQEEVSQIKWNGNDYIWEPGDYVFVRIWHQTNKRKRDFIVYRGQVTTANDPVNEEDKQDVVVLIMGSTYPIDPEDIAPDMTIEVQRNRFRDTSGELVDDAYKKGAGEYDGESKEAYLDHNNDRYLYGNIVYAGNRLTFAPVQINLTDISESRKQIRVINESNGSGEPYLVDVENIDVDMENWPWAVIVDSENPDEDKQDEPLRKIRVNPVDFVNADAESDGQEGLVQCIIGDKETKMLKKHIRILS